LCLQIPDPTRFAWESNSLIIAAADSNGGNTSNDQFGAVVDFINAHLDEKLLQDGGRTLQEQQVRVSCLASCELCGLICNAIFVQEFERRVAASRLANMKGFVLSCVCTISPGMC